MCLFSPFTFFLIVARGSKLETGREELFLFLLTEKKMPVYWGRIGGFPWWPCRKASSVERERLLSSMNQRAAERSQDKHCVVFLGSLLQKGWVTDKSLQDFDVPSFSSKLVEKSLFNDPHYLEGVVEGCRVSRCEGLDIPEHIFDTLRDAARSTWQNFKDIDWDREDVCTVCHGSEWSGESLVCDECNLRETHFHCLETPILQAPEDDWFCPLCEPFVEKSRGREPAPIENGKPPKSKGEKRSRVNGHTEDDNDNKAKRGRKPKEKVSHQAVALSTVPENKHCEVCKVNGLPNELITCTFPGCSKVYHPTCVHKRVTFPLSEYPLQSSFSGVGSSQVSELTFEPWFCPSHFCATCSAMEKPQPPDSDKPEEGNHWQTEVVYPLFVIANGLHRDGNKELHTCSQCPLALCADCLDLAESGDEGVRQRVFQAVSPKKFNERKEVVEDVVVKEKRNPREAHFEKDTVTSCSLCINRDYPLRLGRFLEKLLTSVFTNKLSTPFICPFLPGMESFDTPSEYEGPGDLISILEKVRQFGYGTFEDFQEDFVRLRGRVEAVLLSMHRCAHSSVSAEAEQWVSRHCLLQSFDTISDEVLHLSPEMRKSYSVVCKGVSKSDFPAVTALPLHAELWRKGCQAELPPPYSRLHRVPPRSEALWRKHLSLSSSLAPPQPRVAEVITELEDAERFNTKSTVEALLNIRGEEWDGDTALFIEQFQPGGTSSLDANKDEAVNTRQLMQVLQESTRTALRVQEQLSKKMFDRENVFRLGETEVTVGDMHLLAELKLANDNLRWRLERQTEALNGSVVIIEQLKEENDNLKNKLSMCSCLSKEGKGEKRKQK